MSTRANLKRNAAKRISNIIISSDSEVSDGMEDEYTPLAVIRKTAAPKRTRKLDQVITITDEDDESVLPAKRRKPAAPKQPKTNATKKKVRSPKTTNKRVLKEKQIENNANQIGNNLSEKSQVEKKPEIFKVDANRTTYWNFPALLAEKASIDIYHSCNIIKLLEEDNTIPFICRYRRELVGKAMTPEILRDIKNAYSELVQLKTKIDTNIKSLEKRNLMDDEVKMNFLKVRTSEELELVYAPFKQSSKKTLAERACSMGLEQPANDILHGTIYVNNGFISNYINPNKEEINTQQKVEDGIRHIIGNIFSKNSVILEEIRRLQDISRIKLEVKQAKHKKSDQAHEIPMNEIQKFSNYFDYSIPVHYAKPHQILAINRGENSKILSVKLMIPDGLKYGLKKFIEDIYMKSGIHSKERWDLFNGSFEETYTKKFQSLISKQMRSDLTKLAEKASINVFATNLKQLLLMSPVRGEKILGIDPGFTMGCKCALINECTDVLETFVIYPCVKMNQWKEYGFQLSNVLRKHNCNLIALGNGSACRETEKWLTTLYDNNILDINKTKYCIISEQGASIYSCSPIAKKEFPQMDVNLISAVSIARRLNDPMCELVKVEPKHLGVGMYQHDINVKDLSETLNEVVMECVSFVGVDVNTASVSLLKHVAGMTESRAENLIKHRSKNGPFRQRKEILKVKSIGEKTFVQCAGFIKIDPMTLGNYPLYNIFDQTWVHPESYDLAEKIILTLNLIKSDIGKKHFITKIQNYTNDREIKLFSNKFNESEERIQSILEALQRDISRDYRSDFNKEPLFKQRLTKMSDLSVGTKVSGAVTNITDFGCFVDIGVERAGLIHSSKLKGMILNIGDRVEASVINIELSKERIGLELDNLM